ncbi:hypothetical protein EEB12_28755 [Rhodococcus sp. WS1]|uniref:hypothetical protein n=1 Tax=unclassified Rhodococcus (in: high G+C Gram-positive bacteria) TaxID=192944 RepID=UPI0011422707|nr:MULTISPECIES: hypothetical protein [unclassified Rhodococcus (in: high G+C Gram-positive bacteria)]ROZ53011.1 hypothetical protein EEB12_28755 [Rhodococcus sp. WS1]TQC35928.1 hypothetical protein EEB16_20380 [Rhodococcus sp. WS7]
MKLSKRPQRHPAVVDLLGGTPTTARPGGAANAASPGGSVAPKLLAAPQIAPGAESPQDPRRWNKKAVIGGVAGLAVVAVIAGTMLNGGGDQPENTAAAATTTESESDTLPILDLPETSTTPTPASSEVDDECRADRGDQNSGAGVIAAWNHAYYIQRNAGAARALATPNSSVVPADQLQGFIDSVPVGTNYCMRAKALSEDVYLVDLSELRPEGAERITQTVTTKKIDGKWFVDVFK